MACRKEQQGRYNNGELSRFDPAARAIREGDWTCAYTPKVVEDRRVEITGPVERKMIINTLNSSAKVFMMWKLLAIYKWDMVDYYKIFMKFPSKFWPTGSGTEFFMYVHERRGYFNFWQHLENEYPGGNLLMVTVTDEESRRIEQQPDEETKAEIMVV